MVEQVNGFAVVVRVFWVLLLQKASLFFQWQESIALERQDGLVWKSMITSILHHVLSRIALNSPSEISSNVAVVN